jgi:cell division protease FtsH
MKKKKERISIAQAVGIIGIILVLITTIFLVLKGLQTNTEEKGNVYSEFYETIEENKAMDLLANKLPEEVFVVIDGEGNAYININENKYFVSKASSEFLTFLSYSNISVNNDYKAKQNQRVELLIKFLSTVAMFVMFIAGYWYMTKHMTGSDALPSSGKVKNDKNHNGIDDEFEVSFDNIIGAEDVKRDTQRVVDSLKNPEKYAALGARPTKGILFVGPPGNGKTTLAKALAAEAGANFISASGSDFVEKYVGVGASRVRRLFKEAKKKSPCIIFIDEIDALGGNRDRASTDEKSGTVNALLTEMDGMNSSYSIVVIGATNRLDALDPAVKRSGRFDTTITINKPNKSRRLAALKLYTNNKPLSDDVNLETWALRTADFSYSDIATLANEAALNAGWENKKFLTNENFEDAYRELVTKGGKDRIEDEPTRRITSWHEAGHALAIKLLTDEIVPTITIIGSTSGVGGYTARAPKEDITMRNKKDLETSIRIDYAGRIGEEIYIKKQIEAGNLTGSVDDYITTGASGHIKVVSEIAKAYTTTLGFCGDDSMLDFTMFEGTEEERNRLAKELAKSMMTEIRELITKNEDLLEAIAEDLFVKETMDEDELSKVINIAKGKRTA